LLAGKAGIGQVFSGGRGTHRHGRLGFATFFRQFGIGLADSLFQFRLKRRVQHPLADLLAGFCQCFDVVYIQ